MTRPQIPTFFAPAEKASQEQILEQSSSLQNQSDLQPFIDSVPEVFLILNEQRQIVYSNEALIKFLGLYNEREALGLRPGEILKCTHAHVTKGGCGTTEFCRKCGAVQAILDSLDGKPSSQECRLIQKYSGNALDLRVWASPYRLNGQLYSIFIVSDISDEKRRKALERIFFHDVLNTANGLLGFAKLLLNAPGDKEELYREKMYQLALRLVHEINSQKDLTAAENNELTISPEAILSNVLLNEIVEDYRNREITHDRTIEIDEQSQTFVFISDRTLICRILDNLLKNALEAIQPGETVTLGCGLCEDGIELWVHNPGFIPRDIQLQLFQRSFSTKGIGHGLGLYSVKLLSNRYLKGEVSFTTSPEEGTRFTVKYPLQLTD